VPHDPLTTQGGTGQTTFEDGRRRMKKAFAARIAILSMALLLGACQTAKGEGATADGRKVGYRFGPAR
jgi:predicted small secreted protein